MILKNFLPPPAKMQVSGIVPGRSRAHNGGLSDAAGVGSGFEKRGWGKMSGLLPTDKALARSRACIAESRRLLASIRGNPANGASLVTNSRACIADSRRLLATLAIKMPSAAVAPHTAELGTGAIRSSAMLSVHVFQDGLRFSWTLNAPGHEVLGHGSATSEFEARVDAFESAMTYIDHRGGRAAAENSKTLH